MTTDWHQKAACGDAADDADLWYADDRTAPGRADLEKARAVCARCPVRKPCLAEALIDEGDARSAGRHGMRGGLDRKQRRAVYVRLKSTGRLHVLQRWIATGPSPVERARVLHDVHGLTATEAARRLGLNPKQVQRWRQAGWSVAA